MTEEELLQAIEQAANDSVTKLDLSNEELKALPPKIEKLTNLQELDLSSNQLTTLPPKIGQLTNLQKLNLSSNQLIILPVEIGQLTNLQELDLSSNQLIILPPELSQLSKLKILKLGYFPFLSKKNKLTTLPAEIGQLTNLQELDLSSNHLITLPAEIGQLTNLQKLQINSNQLTTLPAEIGQLTNLQKLDLSSNQLIRLPAEIGQLTNLQELNLSSNQLTALPPTIERLTSLHKLYITGNQLISLPPQIGQLGNLVELVVNDNLLKNLPAEIGLINKLKELHLYHNQLKTLPPEIGQLTNLQRLYLSRNQLTSLPSEIGQLINLKRLAPSYNQLVSLPTEIGQLTNLQKLLLSNNQLTSLPYELEKLTQLKELDLNGNRPPIPPEILRSPPSTIINYFLNLQAEQKKPLNEAKVLLVGQGSVGKTSLVRRLIENRYDPNERKTEGINIQAWQVSASDQIIRLNVWDFGGQEIMHATHQFFLTKRSLYLLVLDTRLGEDENRIEYWLKIIQSFGGNSPIIIIGNKIEQHPLDIDRRGLQTKYKTIKGLVETSCETGQGLEELKAVITEEIAALEHIHDLLPQSWFTLKQQLEKIDQDYMPYIQYEQMCQTQGISDDLSRRTLIGFLHDLGIVLNFREDPRLEDTHVLNPEWVTNGVYRILNDNLLMTEHRGILERSMLNSILDPARYSRNKHLFIVNIMQKFELCFPLEDGTGDRFLIPDLLSKEEPATGDWDNTLAFQYHYDILPSSIISRFIVRMHHLAEKRTWWRTGIVLKHRNNRSLVKADREDKQMFIWVSGSPSTRRELLAMIRSQFNAIHQSIKGLDPKEKVPLPNHPKILVDYEHLLNLEEMGETSFIPEGLKERVSVKHLLNGIEPEQTRQKRQRDRDDEDITKMNRASASSPSINIYNQNNQENRNPMSNIQQNHYGKGDNVAGNKTLNQFNNSPNLAEAARDIKALLDQLSKNYPDDSQAMIGAKAVDQIEKNPTLKQRVINALTEAGATALEEAVEHPAVKIVVAAVKGYVDA